MFTNIWIRCSSLDRLVFQVREGVGMGINMEAEVDKGDGFWKRGTAGRGHAGLAYIQK